jgi:rhodanese-related sulfurtransferase
MDQIYTDFFLNHWVIFSLFVLVGAILLFDFSGGFIRGSTAISTIEAVRLINRENAILVDLRGDADYRKSHIIDAVHIPLRQIPDRVRELKKYQEQPLIVYCQYGTESAKAGQELAKAGFTKVYRLRGGFLGWENEKLPIQS